MRAVVKSLLCGAAALAMSFASVAGAADAYPTKPVTLIVPWAAGGSTDILARVLSEHLTKALGQPVIVDNKPGASGNIGSAMVARAQPDGYTLLVGSMSTHAMNPALMANMPFKGVDDFTPLGLLAYVTNTMVVNPSVPANNVKELIAYAKANPGKLAYASAGPGSTNHLSAVLFEKMAGVEMLHVPYKGGAPAVVDTVAGQTQLLFSAGTQTLPHVKANKLKLLAVTEARRSPLLPNVPTVGETIPGYELSVWYGAFGPKNMPADLVARLNKEINRVMSLPEVKAKMDSIGVETATSTPQEFGKILRRDADRYGKLIKDLGIKGE
ncbi:Bug family tripartite tricarboxylate transporter substrate binding protein [Cupriavidus pauculus]|uniref:Bug family tripartite tricarboxylate transporter substrate binding protein n=1 Tax=Cupriavidus pauculus TaxID=82633 RepID=UPI0012487272|nr:tripartite tricarboxylate transporter substrate binding protein [Cupriavidus pauculus]KAB0603462.1 tripartite tricarboxylate transporter substrate binding protein [Cupriavidus pauculus]MCM3605817.1 tripartite tricarboxylate transporter substrate binding protein [Cupriavidus pauculus]UAL02220.1 tripartite tricarboxylate transporter substrate binding protein [Cupriavidus pauculus]